MSSESLVPTTLKKVCAGLFDDILIYSLSLQDHVCHLHQVFDVIVQHSLLAKRSKYAFGVANVEYLVHSSVATDPNKIVVIQSLSQPTTLNELRGFLRLSG